MDYKSDQGETFCMTYRKFPFIQRSPVHCMLDTHIFLNSDLLNLLYTCDIKCGSITLLTVLILSSLIDYHLKHGIYITKLAKTLTRFP